MDIKYAETAFRCAYIDVRVNAPMDAVTLETPFRGSERGRT